jgi:hypothetical protein
VAGPLLFLIDNLLHPKEYKPDNEVKQLVEIAEHYQRWQLAHFLGFLALIAFVIVALGLAFMVRRRMPRAGLVGGALAMLGSLCLAAVVALDGYTWGVLGETYGRTGRPEAIATALGDIQASEWSYQFYVPAIGFAIGMITLAIAAVRAGLIPAWAGYLFALGSLLVGTEGLIVSNAYYVIGAIVMVAGATAVAIHVWRMSDAEYATDPRAAAEDEPQKPEIIVP